MDTEEGKHKIFKVEKNRGEPEDKVTLVVSFNGPVEHNKLSGNIPALFSLKKTV